MQSDLKLIIDGGDAAEQTEIKVWSQVMANASPYFRTLLAPDMFAEGKRLKDEQYLEIRLEVDALAMRVLCDIFHLKWKDVSKENLSSDDLANIAILVDRFDCAEAVHPWSRSWMQQSHLLEEMQSAKKMSPQVLSKWILIYHTFDRDKVQDLKDRLTGCMSSNDLTEAVGGYLDHVPDPVIEKINTKRKAVAHRFKKIMLDLVDHLRRGRTCQHYSTAADVDDWTSSMLTDDEKFDCSSLALGNALLAVDLMVGDTWQSDLWAGSINEMHCAMQTIAQKLDGPGRSIRGARKQKQSVHQRCSRTDFLLQQVRTVMEEEHLLHGPFTDYDYEKEDEDRWM